MAGRFIFHLKLIYNCKTVNLIYSCSPEIFQGNSITWKRVGLVCFLGFVFSKDVFFFVFLVFDVGVFLSIPYSEGEWVYQKTNLCRRQRLL